MRHEITTATPYLFAFAAMTDVVDQKYNEAMSWMISERYPLIWDAMFTRNMPQDAEALEAEAVSAIDRLKDLINS